VKLKVAKDLVFAMVDLMFMHGAITTMDKSMEPKTKFQLHRSYLFS
jgi:hypothetical protein